MDFDTNKIIDLTRHGLANPIVGWHKYFKGGSSWLVTAQEFTAPVIIVYALLSTVFGSLSGAYSGFFSTLMMSLCGTAISLVVAAFLFSAIGGVMGGNSNFSNSFAAFSLAMIPAYLGSLLSLIVPLIGLLIALAAALVTLVYLYRLMPLALGVPDRKRAAHFAVSLVTVVVLHALVGGILGTSAHDTHLAGGAEVRGTGGNGGYHGGAMGQIQHQATIIEKAEQSTFDPPANGRVTREQLEYQLEVQRKAEKVRKRLEESVVQAEEKLGAEPQSTSSAFSAISSGFSSVLEAANAEMNIVVTGEVTGLNTVG
ncbi:hypothetical protein BST95_18220 [Halioglobus japonicus]|uniref:Yip1 family protein n=1 Tax=Halioglobus japonicus TaxID=930805 RepID=UPI0009793A35|nr:Yip1 family protein [Halioglobus japonicus]AQA19898.1 hypothetical protein BST95_18220 [Halioglobus japonicus]